MRLALISFKEYETAAAYLEQAAKTSSLPKDRSFHLLQAAAALIEAKQSDLAEIMLVKLSRRSGGINREKRPRSFTTSSRPPTGFFRRLELRNRPFVATPVSTVSFKLGFDYYEQKQYGLSLYHYNLLADREPSRSDVMHNLALAMSECDLPVYSVATTSVLSNWARPYQQQTSDTNTWMRVWPTMPKRCSQTP